MKLGWPQHGSCAHIPLPDAASTMRDAYVITVSDGTLLHCEARSFGADYRPLSRHWSIQSTTTQYIGPKVQADRSPQAIRRLIDEWWTMKKAAGAHDARKGFTGYGRSLFFVVR
jgi:hypothetical protein